MHSQFIIGHFGTIFSASLLTGANYVRVKNKIEDVPETHAFIDQSVNI